MAHLIVLAIGFVADQEGLASSGKEGDAPLDPVGGFGARSLVEVQDTRPANVGSLQ